MTKSRRLLNSWVRWGRGALACFPIVAIVALLLLAPPPATAAISLGPTIDLPSSPVDFQGGTVAVLADGSFAIAGYRYDLGFFQYQVQFFSAGGDLLPPVLLEAPIGSTEPPGFAGVGSLGSSYFVVWQPYRLSHGDAVADRHAFAQLYSEKGTPLGSPFQWPSSAVPDFAEFYRFGSAPRWRFLPITYDLLSNDVVDGPTYLVSLRVAKPDKVLHRPPIEIAPPVVSNVEDAAINGTGRFVVVSDQCASYPPPTAPCVRGIQIFHDGMRPLTPFLTADVTQTDFRVFAAINAQGRVLLAFFDPTGRFVARLYDEKGSPASDEIRVDTTREPFDGGVLEMQGLDDGSFVLAWSVFRGGATGLGEALVVERFDPQTKTFEEPVVIATNSDGFRHAVLKLNGDGRGVVVWQNDVAPGFPADAHLRLIRVTP